MSQRTSTVWSSRLAVDDGDAASAGLLGPRSGVSLAHGLEMQALLFAKRYRSRWRRVVPVRLLSPAAARCSSGVAVRLRMTQCGQGAVPPSTPRVMPVT